MSNACASSLGALYLANSWIEKKRVRRVLVLAADHVGRFVMQGFQSLQALSPTRVQPFARNRDGLRLGEAATAILLCDPEVEPFTSARDALTLEAIGMDTEGYAVTRPSQSGTSLKKACSIAMGKARSESARDPAVDLVIAHGTGTQINEVAENQVFQTFFPEGLTPITGTKWSIGHTLAASGAMDFIAGCYALRTQRVFKMANTHEVDSKLSGR
ncbi:MAG: hypothetical protein H7222_09410 [Methylotenera sp.]|nr:hypothetical protein [Oligoflexia bacterium]